MARTNTYGHYCPAARTLEIVGEKWALLVVRDLLEQPQRFSDLKNSLGGITPKLLTARLRDLEAAGVIERDEQEGRRDVWYRITPTGEALAPVLRELVVWGVQFAPGPANNERTTARSAAVSAAALFNRQQRFPSHPVTWEIAYDTSSTRRIRFDGSSWRLLPMSSDQPADVKIATTPGTWVALIRAEPGDTASLLDRLHITGDAEEVASFRALITGRREKTSE